MCKLNIYSVGGETVKDTDTYLLKDNKTLNNLVLSSTRLYSGKCTNGHRHLGQEEIYFFVQGSGEMTVGNEDDIPFCVTAGDVVMIPSGAFHRVCNTGNIDLIFNCVFDGKRNH